MKKILIVFTLIILLNAVGGLKSISAKSTYLINNNGISVSYKDYNQLKVFGLSDLEIQEIEYEEFYDFTSKDIISNYKITKHIETVYTIQDGEIVNQVDSLLSEKEMNLKVEEARLEEKQSNLDSEDILISSSLRVIAEIDPGGGVTSSDIVKTKYESTSYKTFYLYGVYYTDEGNYGEFYIRTTLDWKITPSNRYVDILTLGWNENVQIKAKYYPSSGQEYPDIYSCFTYDRHYSASYVPLTTTHEIVEVFGNEPLEYMYDLSDKEVGIEYDLPSDNGAAGGGYYYVESFDNFYFKMEVRLSVTNSSINGVTFGSSYQHQIGSGSIDWGQISISPLPPYFSYSTSFWVNDPSFDAGIGGFIIFDNIG